MCAQRLRILLVEDNPGDARLVRAALQECGACCNGLEHVDQLQAGLVRAVAGDFDVVLLDLDLPDSQGLDTVQSMHACAPNLPLVVMTSHSEESLGVAALQAGAQDYLVKGDVDPRLLVRVLRHAVTRRRIEEERDLLITELQDALTHVRTLRGLLPICAWCKKVRDDAGYYHQIEEYVAEHSDAHFTHGICPECAEGMRQTLDAGVEAQRKSSILRSVWSCVVSTDGEGAIEMVNAAAEDLLGMPATALQGLRIDDVFLLYDQPKGGHPVPWRALLPGSGEPPPGAHMDGLGFLPRIGERRRAVRYHVTRLPDTTPGRAGLVVTFEDVTERRRSEAQHLSQQGFRLLGVFADGLVETMHGRIGALMRMLQDDTQPAEHRLDAVLTRLRDCEAFADTLAAFGQRAGLVPVHLPGIVRQVCERASAGEPVQTRLVAQADVWTVQGDPRQIEAMVRHLLDNAVDARPMDRAVAVTLDNVQVGMDTELALLPGRYVRLKVSDRGAGLGPEETRRALEPFYTTKPGHPGLGLSIAVSVAQRHGGYLELESEPGAGTCVTVYLPVAPQLAVGASA